MNNRQKKQLAEKFALLYQIHKILMTNGITVELLENCQECAIEIGTQIDSMAGEGTKAVSILEEYCEKVYQTSMLDSSKEKFNCLKAMEELSREAEKSLWYDVRCGKREIVFFPYKASMWDSLESIWLAAKEDENCECYVVPIPYFDKNPDGTIGQMHYEGDKLPVTVPVVDWKEYDVIQRKPDVAYIHNPYDGQNYVTSVHPHYYAKELKKHVGKLIYCPYFVSGETVDSKYCTLPGVLWADKVILQSEHIRQQYIRHYDEVVSDEKVREVLGCGEDKFVALGSPKVDKVRFAQRDKEELPKEWELLCKDKKVVFYNTHLTEALAYGEVYIEKLKEVLAFFEGNKEFVLWWRPHPLSEESMAALKPEILKEYQEIVVSYREKAYGIYDDTPYWHRAVIWSDIYYGSRGSLLPLFGITGKPVVLQKTNHLSEQIIYEAFVSDEDIIYLLSGQLGVLVSLNLQTEEWKVEAHLPWELQGELSVFSRLFVCGDKIYIFVVNANAHFVYDKQKKSFEKVIWHVNNIIPKPNAQIKFVDILRYNQYFIMMPHRFDAIVVYNSENGEVISYTEWKDVLRKQIKDFSKGEFYFRNRSVCIVENYVFAVLRRDKADVICRFSLPHMQLEQVYELPIEGVLQCMEYDGESLWMVHNFGKGLVQWDYAKNECKTYENKTISNPIQWLQYRLIILNKKIYLYPIKKDRKCLVLKDNALIEINDDCVLYQDRFDVRAHEGCGIRLEDNRLVFMDAAWKTQREFELKCPKEYSTDRAIQIKLEALQNVSELKYLTENALVQFVDWLQFLTMKESGSWNEEVLVKKYAELFQVSGQSAGSLIHEYVMKQLEE